MQKKKVDLKHLIQELREMCLTAGFTQEEIDACKGGNDYDN